MASTCHLALHLCSRTQGGPSHLGPGVEHLQTGLPWVLARQGDGRVTTAPWADSAGQSTRAVVPRAPPSLRLSWPPLLCVHLRGGGQRASSLRLGVPEFPLGSITRAWGPAGALCHVPRGSQDPGPAELRSGPRAAATPGVLTPGVVLGDAAAGRSSDAFYLAFRRLLRAWSV